MSNLRTDSLSTSQRINFKPLRPKDDVSNEDTNPHNIDSSTAPKARTKKGMGKRTSVPKKSARKAKTTDDISLQDIKKNHWWNKVGAWFRTTKLYNYFKNNLSKDQAEKAETSLKNLRENLNGAMFQNGGSNINALPNNLVDINGAVNQLPGEARQEAKQEIQGLYEGLEELVRNNSDQLKEHLTTQLKSSPIQENGLPSAQALALFGRQLLEIDKIAEDVAKGGYVIGRPEISGLGENVLQGAIPFETKGEPSRMTKEEQKEFINDRVGKLRTLLTNIDQELTAQKVPEDERNKIINRMATDITNALGGGGLGFKLHSALAASPIGQQHEAWFD